MSDSRGPSDSLPTGSQNIVSQAGDDLLNMNPVWNLGTGAVDVVTDPHVFNKVLSTVTGQNSYDTDQVESDFKLLNHDGINFPNAMPGLKPGVHQTNMRGDSTIQVSGNHVVQINGDYLVHVIGGRKFKVDGPDDLIVSGQQTYHVKDDAKLLYDQNRTVVVGDQYDLSVQGPSTTFVLGESSEQFVGRHEVTAPEEFEWKHFERGFSYQKLDLADYGLDIHKTAADVHVVDAEVAVIEGYSKALIEKKEAAKTKVRAAAWVVGTRVAIEESANAMLEFKQVALAIAAETV